MIDFIYLAIIFTLILLFLAMFFRVPTLGMLASILMIAIGVVILKDGMAGLVTLLTVTVGIIMVTMGSFIFINGSLQDIEAF